MTERKGVAAKSESRLSPRELVRAAKFIAEIPEGTLIINATILTADLGFLWGTTAPGEVYDGDSLWVNVVNVMGETEAADKWPISFVEKAKVKS